MSIFEKNKGTKLDPYEIWTEDDLRELIDYDDISNPNLAIEFKSDIEMERDWTSSISKSYSNPFKGIINGNGFTIRNLNSSNGSPLINYIDQGTVKNLTLSSVKFNTNSSHTSPFLGQTYDTYSSSSRFSHIINCGVEDAEMNLTSTRGGGVGAILGWAQGTSVNISNSYVKNIRITRGTSNSRGSGAIVGSIQDRTVNLDNVFAFGEIRIYNSTHSRDDYQSSLSANSNRGTINGHVIQATTYSTHNSARRTQTPLVKDSYPSVVSFGQKQGWDMVDGELPFLTYYGEKINPTRLSEFSDLDLIRNNPDGSFILTDDIDASGTSTYHVVFNVDFSGYLNGDGYSIYGINIYPNYTNSHGTLFNSISGHIKNLKLEFSQIYSSNSSYSVGIMTTGNMSGKIENIHATVSGNFQGQNNYGFAGTILDDGIVKNCYININYFRSEESRDGLMGTMANYGEGVVRNNIIRVTRAYRTHSLIRGAISTLQNVSDNVGRGGVPTDGSLIRTTNDEDFRNPDFHGYDNFDKDKWVFFTDEDPTPSPFYIITEKIEERLISLYSKGISLKTRMSKGFKDIIKFFSKKSESDVSTRRIGNRLETNFSETISSKFSRSGKKLRDIKNYTGRALSNFIKSLRVDKRVESYTEDILSRINNIKIAMKSSINKMNKINFNSYYVVIKKYFIGVMTYSKEIVTESSWTKLIRVIKTPKSYTRRMRSLIWRFTNVYEFVVKWTSSYSSPVSSSVVKYSVIKRLSRTYTESISSYSRRLVKRSASALKYARVNVRYNNIKMRVKESMTKIRAINGGGD